MAKEHYIKLILNDALVSAASDGNNLAMKVLLSDQRVDPSTRNNEAIQVASFKGHIEIVKKLLADKRVDPSDDNNKAIIFASVNGKPEIVKLLLANQLVDPSANNNEAIRRASREGNIEVVKLLLTDKRVDPSADDNEAIWLVFSHGNTEIVELLLGSDKIALRVKTRMLKDYELPSLNYKSFKFLTKKSLEELISLGNRSKDAKDIIMTKYFWWLRLKTLYNMDNIKEDPFEVALQQE